MLALVAVGVVAAGCSAGSVTTTTPVTTPVTVTTPDTQPTSPPGTTPGAETSVTTSSTIAPVETTTSSAPVVPRPAATLMIANDAGVFGFASDGSVTELVTGPVVLAVDDARGGVFFQIRRGRFGPGTGTSVVWWIRSGSDTAEAFLVPSEPDHVLSLHDAVEIEGSLRVFYTRGEGSNIEDMAETLRYYDVEARAVTVLGGVGGWESGSDPVSIGGDTIAMTWYAEIFNGFTFWDLGGDEIAVAADPYAGDFCEDRQCEWAVELAPDGATLAYFQQVDDEAGFPVNTDLVVVESSTGAELARVQVKGEQEGWFAESIDLDGSLAVVNRESVSRDGFLEPWMVDFGGPTPTITEVPITGRARLARAPVDIGAPVAAPRP